jgi:hypothetical protein
MHTLNAESLLDHADEAIAELESQKRQAAAAGTVACMRGDMRARWDMSMESAHVRAHLSGAACAMHIDRSVLNLMCCALTAKFEEAARLRDLLKQVFFSFVRACTHACAHTGLAELADAHHSPILFSRPFLSVLLLSVCQVQGCSLPTHLSLHISLHTILS